MKNNIFFRVGIVLFCLAFLAVGFVSNADSLSDKQAALEKEKTEIKQKLEAQKEKLEENQDKIAALEKEKEGYQSEIDKMEMDIEHIFEAIEQIDTVISETEAEYNEKQRLLKERSLVMYQNSNFSQLQMFIQSESLLEYLNRQSYYSAMIDRDQKLLEEVAALKLDLENKKKMQTDTKASLETLKAEKEQLLAGLNQETANLENISESTKKLIDELEAKEEQMRKESDQIAAQIQNSSSSSSSSSSYQPSYGGGPLLWPSVSKRITSYFGMRNHPIYKYPRMHNGIDIGAAGGTNIYAAEAGKVIVSSYGSGYGNYIVVDHGGGITTLYAHASKRIASVGDVVSRGQVIALVGTTGASTGNHLHFEVRVNGSPVNPLNYL